MYSIRLDRNVHIDLDELLLELLVNTHDGQERRDTCTNKNG
jgi:hypothetical protein